MDAFLSAPWTMLVLGGLVLLLAVAAARVPGALAVLLGARAAAALPAPRRRAVLAALGGVGAAWLLAGALLALRSADHAPPFVVTVALVVLLPLTPVAFIATVAWILRLRVRPPS